MSQTPQPRADLSWVELVSLLAEARDQITDKPWEDTTELHARISRALGLPLSYPDWGVINEKVEDMQ
jgi:hypothetical protein